MNPADWKKIKDIFNAAVNAEPSARDELLERECRGNDGLRREVEALLRSDRSTFMERAGIDIKEDAKADFPPTRFLDRFEIIELIGVGGMGKVYLARDDKLERKVAIKIINENFDDRGDGLRRFIQEAKAASALNHPSILTIYEFGETEGCHYIVSEYIDGSTLRDLLGEERLELSKCLDITIQIAEALTTAHAARIIHRDIKPENIIIRHDGYVKVLDFGLAKLMPEQNPLIGLGDETVRQNQTAKGLILGTVKYMSPEQAKGAPVDHRTDIFSFGVLLYEMIAGRTPFTGETNSESFANLINKEPDPLHRFVVGVPDELQRIISKMLQKGPDDRYQTFDSVLTELKEVKENLSLRQKGEFSARVGDETNAILSPNTARGPSPQTSEMQKVSRFASVKFLATAAVIIAAAIFGLLYDQPEDAAYSSSPAYDLYLRGKVNAGSENQENNERSIELLEQAIAIDPGFAPAYAELARSYNVKAFYLASPEKRAKLIEDAQFAPIWLRHILPAV